MTSGWEGLTPEEIGARAAREWQEALDRARAEGRPPVEVSRVKRNDYPHLEHVGWGFQVRTGAPAEVRDVADGRPRPGMLRGLRRGADGATVLVLDLGRGGVWGLRRRDGVPWPDDLGAWSVKVDEVDLEVSAWRLPTEACDAGTSVDLVGEPSHWIARTGQLEGD